jgi:hypothetical protein
LDLAIVADGCNHAKRVAAKPDDKLPDDESDAALEEVRVAFQIRRF